MFRGIYLISSTKSIFLVALDIFIVSFFIYKIYMLLRRTRGIQLLMGVVFIWILGSVAEYMELELLDWIITNIRPALVFAIIVLLQPELRRITGDLTRFRFVNLFLMKPTYDLDPIVDAVKTMASSKIGSIIVLTKEISLKNIVEDSIQLDALVSSPLLQTIFMKNTPLHDGAVIIEQNRVVSAASYLPMTHNLENSTFGARHRSALGLAEEADAVIIVTSEETGEISVCFDSEMIHPVKPLELKSLVNSLLLEKKRDKKYEDDEK
ncbi:diadenylate cyclase CdaA [Leptospira sp. GIMC2001]|nr:diadenylate cyclase CdaA [Leptospira sp. GIMC2001]WCL51386.1 diadenylate cyclase CdaA [Leptospira sp. GIMC2001]